MLDKRISQEFVRVVNEKNLTLDGLEIDGRLMHLGDWITVTWQGGTDYMLDLRAKNAIAEGHAIKAVKIIREGTGASLPDSMAHVLRLAKDAKLDHFPKNIVPRRMTEDACLVFTGQGPNKGLSLSIPQERLCRLSLSPVSESRWHVEIDLV